MSLAFDLISDLHIETWPDFDWTYYPTSPFCVVAGDVAQDPLVLKKTLEHLASCYRAVFYIDGNDEHRWFYADIGSSYRELKDVVEGIEDLIYLQDNVVVINGVAILGTNGWWTWDFDPSMSVGETQSWFVDRLDCQLQTPNIISGFAQSDANYLRHSIAKLQMHPDVKKIVVVTHTVPDANLIKHDIDLDGTYRFNCMGNSQITQALDADTEHKVSHWCFGHYHGGDVDRTINGVRYINNCRGRGDSPWKKTVYNPLRIEVLT